MVLLDRTNFLGTEYRNLIFNVGLRNKIQHSIEIKQHSQGIGQKLWFAQNQHNPLNQFQFKKRLEAKSNSKSYMYGNKKFS